MAKKSLSKLKESNTASKSSSQIKNANMAQKSASKLKKSFKKGAGLREAMLARMESARLRFLNDEMYSDKKNVLTSKAAFNAYHESFRKQQELWESNPVDYIISDIKKMYLKAGAQTDFTIADLGCGDAKIAHELEETQAKIHSIDFVAVNNKVTAGDMAHTNIKNDSVDVVVFSLSLMSSKCNDYIREARRILKRGGRLLIAEVTSRLQCVKGFINVMKEYGFVLYAKVEVSDGYFTYFKFNKVEKINFKPSDIILLPCKYKKR